MRTLAWLADWFGDVLRLLAALLLAGFLAVAGCGPSLPPLPGGGGGGAPPLPRDGASLKAIREGRAAFESRFRAWAAAREQWAQAEREAEIAQAQAWLNALALILAAVGVAFAVASIWLPVLRSLILYVTGFCLSAALGLKFLAVVWPWFWLIATIAGLLAVGLLVLWAVRLRAKGLDAGEGFAILSGAGQELAAKSKQGAAWVAAIVDRLSRAKRLNREQLKALRDKAKAAGLWNGAGEGAADA
jgi:hypothetical protein